MYKSVTAEAEYLLYEERLQVCPTPSNFFSDVGNMVTQSKTPFRGSAAQARRQEGDKMTRLFEVLFSIALAGSVNHILQILFRVVNHIYVNKTPIIFHIYMNIYQ